MINKLFVYGTLQVDFNNRFAKYLKKNAEYLCRGKILGKLFDIGSYPGAKKNEVESYIEGEVYHISSKEVLDHLDEYEGYYKKDIDKSEYIRKCELIATEDGKNLRAWVYWYLPDVGDKKVITAGNYKKYILFIRNNSNQNTSCNDVLHSNLEKPR